MPTKPRLYDVLDTLGEAISAAVNAGLVDAELTCPGQTYNGHAVTTKLAAILSNLNGNHAVVLWPLAARPTTRYSSSEFPKVTPPTVNLTREIAENVITFGGTVNGTYNVHTVLGNYADAFVQTTNGQTPAQVAAAVAAAINTLDLAGITAMAVGTAMTIDGVDVFECNIGGTGSIQRTVGLQTRLIQVSVYAPDPDTRTVVGQAVIDNIGTTDDHCLLMSDGQALNIFLGQGESFVEKAQSSYSAFEWHIFFEVEYPITQTHAATQVGVIETIPVKNGQTFATIYNGG